jgi:hypothetical protein
VGALGADPLGGLAAVGVGVGQVHAPAGPGQQAVNVSKDGKIIPYRIQKAMAGSSLLFVGYSLADWNFRILFRGLVNTMESSLRRASITVQLPPGNDKASQEQAQNYLDKYFNGYKMKVYWGKASDFVGELRSRWQEFSKGE